MKVKVYNAIKEGGFVFRTFTKEVTSQTLNDFSNPPLTITTPHTPYSSVLPVCQLISLL